MEDITSIENVYFIINVAEDVFKTFHYFILGGGICLIFQMPLRRKYTDSIVQFVYFPATKSFS